MDQDEGETRGNLAGSGITGSTIVHDRDDSFFSHGYRAQDSKICERSRSKTVRAGQLFKEYQGDHSIRMGTLVDKDTGHEWQQPRHGDAQNGERETWPSGEQS